MARTAHSSELSLMVIIRNGHDTDSKPMLSRICYLLKTIRDQTDRTSCRIKTVYETAKQMTVIATRKMR